MGKRMVVRQNSCSEKVGLRKGPWAPEEDQKLLAYVQQHGHGNWCSLPAKAGLKRCGKSCRLRWTNYLRPDIKRGKFSSQEEQTIIQLHALLGNRWSTIAAHLPKRTDNEIKNYWNSHIKKRLAKIGIDPVTHKKMCKVDSLGSELSHITQWEATRLQAEARLVQNSKNLPRDSHLLPFQILPASRNHLQTTIPPPLPSLPCLDILKVWQGILFENVLKLPIFDASMMTCDQDIFMNLNQELEVPMAMEIAETAYPTDVSLNMEDPWRFAGSMEDFMDHY